MRGSGILLPVASLPGKYGIGSFSKEAYKVLSNGMMISDVESQRL